MALRKNTPNGNPISLPMKPLNFSRKLPVNVQISDPNMAQNVVPNVDLDLREVYFLMLHLLSSGPCQNTYTLLRHELLEHELLPRRYHAWYSRSGLPSGDENDDGISFPLNYTELAKRYSHIKKDHLVELLKQLVCLLSRPTPSRGICDGNKLIAAGVPTLLGTGSFSLLSYDKDIVRKSPPIRMRWPHMHADQVRGISLREIGGGFSRHHRAPSIRAACYVIAKPSSMVQKMQNIKRLRGHRNAVYCAIFDRSGRYVITGSDDRLVKIWSMETAYCLASCRGHEGDITDLAVSSNNLFIASASNDCVIRVWRLPDGFPVSVLRGHTGAVTAIAFSPRPGSPYQLLSSSDDGTCRIWDARGPHFAPRIFVPRPPSPDGKNSGPSSSTAQQTHQIFCCAFNSNGSVFVTGSSDTLARVYSVWSASKTNNDDPEQPNHEMDVLAGHENDVNYVQFSGCTAGSRFAVTDYSKDENVPKFKNSWFCHDNIVTCSRDGSAIIWIPRSRRSHGKSCRWTRAYHLKVPPPPMPPQPPRGGPRQRILPTPRGVNMIAWSLDNRFVLAAIMDCRICVWNASDGSLVHSLTGHSASTYVMDVHPFNPRIAMSAGYDGKTIVWDIWEGIPIQIYEISHYKLVDGKFSPDGTSIILSDDVGQLYVLSTGQGDSQKDAKYDQFFLGDYRPLIQDTYGNVLDQESQLTPYRRNMEDPLCDSGMIPYEEPYQTLFQKRRLGALGKEWRPSSLKLAVGPDITLDQDYQMPPLADLDLAEPLPEFVDAMDWEPEIDILSDDNDSEYNVPEEYSSGKEQECLSSPSSESGSSSRESGEDDDNQNSLRRSKRRKHKTEAGIMTSSGRRVKKRNFDELDGAPRNNKRNRKSRSGRKRSKRRSSKSKASRPRRVAARNARSWLTNLVGTSKEEEEEEEDGSELDDSSESESTTQDSGTEESEVDVALLNGHGQQTKGKNIIVCDSDDGAQQCDIRETHPAERKRLVLRFPVRNSDKLTLLENLPGSSSDFPTPTLGNGSAEDTSVAGSSGIHSKQLEGLDGGKIKWGMVKARTSKRVRGEAITLRGVVGSDLGEKENSDNQDANHHDNGLTTPSCSGLKSDLDGMTVDTGTVMSNGLANDKEHSLGLDGSPSRLADEDTSNCSQNVTDCLHDLKDSLPPISMKLKIRSKRGSRGPDASLKQEGKSSVVNQESGGSDALIDGSADIKCDLESECQNDGTEESLRNSCSRESNLQIRDPVLNANDSSGSLSNPKRMFTYVYRRLKSRKHNNNSDGGSTFAQETSSGCNQEIGDNSHEGTPNGFHGTQSNGLQKPESSLMHIRDSCTDTLNTPAGGDQNSQEEWGSTSGATPRLRSTRNRRSTYAFSETKPIETKKPQQLIEKVSWLTLFTHEEGSRYIPQKGDEVAYLRQGHQEYLNFSSLREVAPWSSIKGGNIKAVEICKIESLEYATLPGSGDSCCKMILKVIDPNSEVFNKSFKLTLPEVVTFPDFLVERSRYEAAINRNWTCRDKCKVWWRDEGEEDGSWWEGRILAVKPKSPDFPDSPWERYTVKYKSDPTETHLHSPWELFDADTKWEQPHIDVDTRNHLLSALKKLETSGKRTQDPYGLQKLNQAVGKTSYTNRFPVPLSLEVIRARLENNYYRSLEALRHDVAVMLSNAETFFGRNASVAAKISHLSNWFERTLPSL